MTASPIEEAKALFSEAVWPAVAVTITDSGEVYPREHLAQLLVPVDPNPFESTSDAWRRRLDWTRENRQRQGKPYAARHRAQHPSAWRP